MKNTIAIVFALATLSISAQEQTSQIIVTNLSDKLRTRVTIDRSTGMDIRRLNLDSIHADKHKSRHTDVRKINVNVPSVRKVIMARPLLAKDDDGKVSRVDNIYIDTHDIKTINAQSVLMPINRLTTKNMLVQDLRPIVFHINDGKLSLANIGNIGVQSISLLPIAVNSIDIANLGISQIEVKKLYSSLVSVQKLQPYAIVVDNASRKCPVIVIDSSNFHVDVTEDTYAELAEMKLIYSFEQDYNESIKTEAKLNDIRRLDRKTYIKWINLLNEHKSSNIELIKNKEYNKVIGEAWIYQNKYSNADRENMQKNLAFFKEHGYNAVLVRFDCTEDKQQLVSLLDDIAGAGFKVFAVYVGQDNLCPRWNPYIEPEVIDEYFQLVAPKCTAFLLNWRSTSNHVKILPIEFFNFICCTARKHNPHVLIYGEVYYGRIDPLRMTTLVYTVPNNATGIVINNMGYYGYNTTYIVNSLFASAVPNYRKLDKLGQVIGYGPYYCSRPEWNAHLSLDDEYKYKDNVEKAFKRTGYGTVTMSHDGVDDNYTSLTKLSPHWTNTTDNIIYDTKIWKAAKTSSIIK